MTLEHLKKWLHYNPETGVWTWIKGEFAGYEAGYIRQGRYRRIVFGLVDRPASRMSWFYMTGYYPEPPTIVDHINRVSFDDKFINLRLATPSQNEANKEPTGFYPKGVSQSKSKYKAEIRIDGQKIYLGTFDTPEEAGRAYMKKALELYGEFACG